MRHHMKKCVAHPKSVTFILTFLVIPKMVPLDMPWQSKLSQNIVLHIDSLPELPLYQLKVLRTIGMLEV